MVNRDFEKTLDLVCMQVHGHQAIDACCGEQVGDEFRSDSDPRLVLSILSCKSKIRDYRNDSLCTCSFRRVDE